MPDDGRSVNGVVSEAAFSFEVHGVDVAWNVSRLTVRERLCAPFEATVEVTTGGAVDAGALLGLPCVMTISREGDGEPSAPPTRRFAGVVTSVGDLGTSREARVFEVGFGPSLALLEHRAHHRVWQGVDALRVVREVLDDAKLYPSAMYTPPSSSGDAPAAREYCVQFGETDLDFMRRLLAEEGVLFTVGAGGGHADTLELFDARAATARPTLGVLSLLGEGSATASHEGLRRVDLARALTVASVSVRDADFTHPREPLSAPENRVARTVERYPARFVLGAYDEAAHTYGAPDVRRTARIALQQHTARAETLTGEGTVTGLRPGLRFALTESGERAIRGDFLLTAVLHVGEAPDTSLGDGRGTSGEERYRNVFEGVPVGRAWAAPTVARPRADHAQVAVVRAEPGSDEEICTDHYGRVLVRFAWDRPEARRASQAGTRDSCWLRVMQPWAGDGWGFHFTPRVGMEVVVHFFDGDPDRPYVAGCLPNALNPPPVDLPRHRTQSALRTHSSPTTGGYNELRFEDAAGSEEVYLRAQRDQRVEVLHDRALSVGRDAQAHVARDEALFVGRDRSIDVTGHEQHSVEGNAQRSVGGDATYDVSGSCSVLVHKGLSAHMDEAAQVGVNDKLAVFVGGNAGTSAEVTPDAVSVRAPKRCAIHVGDEAAQQLTPERYTAKAPKGLSLVCGDTRIEVTEDKIVLQTKGGAKVELQGDKITLKTDGPVNIKGSNVSNNG